MKFDIMEIKYSCFSKIIVQIILIQIRIKINNFSHENSWSPYLRNFLANICNSRKAWINEIMISFLKKPISAPKAGGSEIHIN